MTRPPQPPIITTVPLHHVFTKEERIALSSQQNAHLAKVGELDAKLKAVQKAMQEEIAREMKGVHALRRLIESGGEIRPREVRVEFNPTAGTKTYFDPADVEGNAPLGTEEMVEKDYELPLPL